MASRMKMTNAIHFPFAQRLKAPHYHRHRNLFGLPGSRFVSLFFSRTIQSEVEQKKKEDEVRYMSTLKQKIADFVAEAAQDMEKENNARFESAKTRVSGKKKKKSKSSDSSRGSAGSDDESSADQRDEKDDDDDTPPKKKPRGRGKRPRESKAKPAKNQPKEIC